MSSLFKKLFARDQEAIRKWSLNKITDKEFYEINKKLRNEIGDLLKSKKILSNKDYFVAAIIFHHGFKISYSKKAVVYAKKAVSKGYKDKWIIASTIDRLLQLQKKPQKYGTQIVETKKGKKKIYKLDPKTTDEERKEYGLPPLKEKKKYYGII